MSSLVLMIIEDPEQRQEADERTLASGRYSLKSRVSMNKHRARKRAFQRTKKTRI